MTVTKQPLKTSSNELVEEISRLRSNTFLFNPLTLVNKSLSVSVMKQQSSLTPGRLSQAQFRPGSGLRRSSLPSMVSSSPMPFHSPVPTPIANRAVLEITSITLANSAFKSSAGVSMALFCTLKVLQHTTSFKSSQMDSTPRNSVTTYKFPSSPWNRIEQILHRSSSSPLVQLVVRADHAEGELVGEGIAPVLFSTAMDYKDTGILSIMTEGTKVGEAKYNTYHPVEGFLDDSASEDGDQASATPSPLVTTSSLHLTPGRMLDSRINLSFHAEANHESEVIEEEEVEQDKENIINVDLSPRTTRSGLPFDGSGTKKPRTSKSPKTPKSRDSFASEIDSTISEKKAPVVSQSNAAPINVALLVLVVLQTIAIVALAVFIYNTSLLSQSKDRQFADKTSMERLELVSESYPTTPSIEISPILDEILALGSAADLEDILVTGNSASFDEIISVFPSHNEELKIKVSDSAVMMVQLFATSSSSASDGCLQWKVSMTGGSLSVGDCSSVDSWWQVTSQAREKNALQIIHLKSQRCLNYANFVANKDATFGKIHLQNCGKSTAHWSYDQYGLMAYPTNEGVELGVSVDNKGRRKVELVRSAKLVAQSKKVVDLVEVKLQMNIPTRKSSIFPAPSGHHDILSPSTNENYLDLQTILVDELVFSNNIQS